MPKTASAIQMNTTGFAFVLTDMRPSDRGGFLYAPSQDFAIAHPNNAGVYKASASSHPFGSWVAQDTPGETQLINDNAALTDDGGSLVYLAAPDTSGTRNLLIHQFDMSTDMWTSIATGGPGLPLGGNVFLGKLSSGDFVAVYLKFGSPDRIYAVVYSGGWGTPQLLTSAGGSIFLLRLLGIAVDSADRVHVLWDEFGSPSKLQHAVFSAGAFGSTTTIVNPTGNPLIFRGNYIAATDEVVFAIASSSGVFPAATSLLRIAAASTSPTYSFEAVSNTAGFDVEPPTFMRTSDGIEVVMVVADTSNMSGNWLKYSYFRKNPASSWSVTDTTIWDGSVDVSDPVALGTDQGACARLLSDDRTIGIVFPALAENPSTHVIACGVTYYTSSSLSAATLTTVKAVIGGAAVPTDWTISATGPDPQSGAGGFGPVVVTPGDYVISESTGPAGYIEGTPTLSGTGTLLGHTVTLAAGDNATVTLTNLGTTLSLVKLVIGGSAVPADWTLEAAGPTPLSGAGVVPPTAVTPGDYPLTETGPTGYRTSGFVCVGMTAPQVGQTVTIAPGDNVVCTIRNTKIIKSPPPQYHHRRNMGAG